MQKTLNAEDSKMEEDSCEGNLLDFVFLNVTGAPNLFYMNFLG